MRLQIRRDSSPLAPSTAICLGAFDGLHRGHATLVERARAHSEHVALVTFDPHPQRVLAPDRPLVLLLTAAQRERTAAALGVETLVLLPFDVALSRMSAEDFVHTRLAALAPTAVVVGADFRFGAGRRGDAKLLEALLPAHGIAVEVVAPVASGTGADPTLDQADRQIYGKISSSTIRDAISRGDVAAARAMLGRPHAVIGTVVLGDRRGRAIGIPTANVDTHAAEGDPLVPAGGVYAVWLSPVSATALLSGPVAGVANIGTNPTFTGSRAMRLEVHVIDRDLGDTLYGATVEVWFVERLRDELKFAGIDALVAQIHADIDHGRARLVSAEHDGVLPGPEPAP